MKDPRIRRLIASVAFIGLALSVMVHGAAFLGVDLIEKFPLVWGLHLGIFPLFLLMMLATRREEKDSHGLSRPPSPWKRFFDPMPLWAKYITYALGAYTLINFAWFFSLSKGGTPELREGIYVLHDHGKIIRELTEQEYHIQKAYVLRGFSGHWLYFYVICGFYFWFPRKMAHEG
jgi:hypothetical protein